jgi:hypothetical protein
MSDREWISRSLDKIRAESPALRWWPFGKWRLKRRMYAAWLESTFPCSFATYVYCRAERIDWRPIAGECAREQGTP